MSDNHSECTEDLSRFDGMTTEELLEILREDAKKTDTTEEEAELILDVLQVYAQRKKDEPRKTPEEAYEIFKRDYLPFAQSAQICAEFEKKAKTNGPKCPVFRRILRPLATMAAALALVVGCALTARSFGIDIVEPIVKWTSDLFYFDHTVNTEPAANERETDELSSGDLKRMVPEWIPEGYELAYETWEDESWFTGYVAVYQRGGKEMVVSFQKVDGVTTDLYMKSAGEVVEYRSRGLTFYLFDNLNRSNVVWNIDGIACSIGGELTYDQLKMMVDSIDFSYMQ